MSILRNLLWTFCRYATPPRIAQCLSSDSLSTADVSALVANLIPAIKTIHLTAARRVDDNMRCSVWGHLSLGGGRRIDIIGFVTPFLNSAEWRVVSVSALRPFIKPRSNDGSSHSAASLADRLSLRVETDGIPIVGGATLRASLEVT